MGILMNDEPGKYGKYVVQTLQAPVTGDAAFQEMYRKFASRILWMDGNVVPGAFQMNTAWYYAVPERDPVFPEHSHPEDELIGFFGSDPDDPYDLHAEIEVAIDGERRLLTRSTMMFVPGGISHMPMRILRVDRPVFHFSIVNGTEYNGGAYK